MTYAVTFSPVSLAIAILLAASLALRSKPRLATRGLDIGLLEVPSRNEAALRKAWTARTRGDKGESCPLAGDRGVTGDGTRCWPRCGRSGVEGSARLGGETASCWSEPSSA